MARRLPLEGRTVLLTRPAARAEGLVRRLHEQGAAVETRPTIGLAPPHHPEMARDAVEHIARYDWIVFTSANGVRFFNETLFEVHGADYRPSCSIAAIGPATAAEAERCGLPPNVVPRDSRSEGLAESLAGRVAPGMLVLIVRPERARPVVPRTLAALGAAVDAIPFYLNVPAPDVDAIVEDICGGRFDAIVLTSPSSLERILESGARRPAEIERALEETRLVAIGQVTANAMSRRGLKAASTAAEPTDEGLAEAVIGLFR